MISRIISNKMATPKFSRLLLILSLLILCFSKLPSSDASHDFVKCLPNLSPSSSNVVYARNNSSYLSVLQSSVRNLRFPSPTSNIPLFIVMPTDESEIPAVVYCAKENGLQLRTRSGGHDFEGLSYTTNFNNVSFVLVDLQKMSQIEVDVATRSAWVQTGATLGQLYYHIANKSATLAFPAGTCPTVGVGGHISGGGFGYLLRKYGLAADNVIDAHLVDVNGRILDRKSMGEDLFWAIRGGGGASFGVITAWKLQLVDVPEKLTVFSVKRNLEQNATKLFHRWQHVAPNLPEDLIIKTAIRRVNSSSTDGAEKTIQVTFVSLFLGEIDNLLSIMQQDFPELGIRREDCLEMSWIQSMFYFAGFPNGTSLDALLNRVPSYIPLYYFKAKSDYVEEPIPEYGIEGIWEFFFEKEADLAFMDGTPYGGRMKEIPESAIPFPHRAGNLYKIMPMVQWSTSTSAESEGEIDWSRRLYSYLTPYVSKHPRAAYYCYRDLDLGVNNADITSYEQASRWGLKYFKNNFNHLVRVKKRVDPANYFRDEQSIPPLGLQTRRAILFDD